MKVPSNYTEREVIAIIDKVLDILAPKFRFGTHSVEDMRQQGWVYSLSLLNGEKYDAKRSLDNFLYIHIKNRFLNYKRDHYWRAEPACECCSPNDENEKCARYMSWLSRNKLKRSLTQNIQLETVTQNTEQSSDLNLRVEISDMEQVINAKLPTELRSDYLKLKRGVAVPKKRKENLIRVLKEILNVSEGSV